MISRNVPRLRFKGFEDEWQEDKAKEIFHNVSIKNNKNLPVLAATQNEGIIYRSDLDKNILYDPNTLKNYKLVENGNIVISLRSFQGGFEVSNKEGIISPAYTILNCKNKDSNKYYWKVFLKTYNFIQSLKKVTYGIRDGRSISYKDFSSLKIKYTNNISEQQRIGNFFFKLDHLIDLHSRKLEQLKKLKRGYLQKMFPQKGESVPRLRFSGFSDDWKKIKLNTLLKVGKSGGTPSTKKKKYYQGDIPFLSIKDVTSSNGVVTSTEKHITEEGLNNSSSWIVPSGALTLSMYASVGEVAKFGIDISTSQAFFNMVFNEKTSSDFMYYYLKEFDLNGSWNRFIATGTQSNLNANSIKNAVLKISGIDEQKRIYIFLNHLDDLINENSDRIEELNRQKKAYLQKMFI